VGELGLKVIWGSKGYHQVPPDLELFLYVFKHISS